MLISLTVVIVCSKYVYVYQNIACTTQISAIFVSYNTIKLEKNIVHLSDWFVIMTLENNS